MRFTKPFKIFNIGDKIFPVDFSLTHKKGENTRLEQSEEGRLKEGLEKGIGFIVISMPYQIPNFGWFADEYYIDVKVEGTEDIYTIGNTIVNVFWNAGDYNEFVYDCEACASCGY